MCIMLTRFSTLYTSCSFNNAFNGKVAKSWLLNFHKQFFFIRWKHEIPFQCSPNPTI